MPGFKATVRLNQKKRIVEVGANIRRGCMEQVEATAKAIEAQAKATVPVDTGRLRSTIHASEVDATTWEVTEGGPSPEYPEGADYALHVELGSLGRPAMPHFIPAVEEVAHGFEKAMRQAAADAVREAG